MRRRREILEEEQGVARGTAIAKELSSRLEEQKTKGDIQEKNE